MQRFVVGLSLGLMLAACGAVQAKTAVIDFTGDTPVATGMKLVNNSAGSDGVVNFEKRDGKNYAVTGNTDAARYLYLALDSAFKTGLGKTMWVVVEYLDVGKGGFKLQFESQNDAYDAAPGPNPRPTYDTQALRRQTWHLPEWKLAGGMQGGADIRIDDRGGDDKDGPEYIARVLVSDEDPNLITFPYATKKIVIDGKIDGDEWAGAYPMVLDHPQQDGYPGSPNWKGPEQFSGKYSFKYDETAFYVLGEVTDTTPRLNTTDDGVNYWNGDGTEQFISLDDADPERTSCEEGKDFQVLVGLGKTPGWGYVPGGVSLDPIGNNVAITDTTGGYLFELQIPWAKLNPDEKMTPGKRVAWYMFANNSQVDPSAQNIALGPTGATGPSCNPHRWIRAVLGPKP